MQDSCCVCTWLVPDSLVANPYMRSANVEALATLVDGSPFAMPALSLLVLLGAICPVPGLFSSSIVSSGFVLGFWPGLAAVYPAAVLGACLSFAGGRYLGRRIVPNKVASLCAAIGDDAGFMTLLLLRLTPLTVCASAAFLGTIPTVRARDHALASAIGFLRLGLHVFVGTTLRNASTGGGSQLERWSSLVAAGLAMLAFGNIAHLLLKRRTTDNGGHSKPE